MMAIESLHWAFFMRSRYIREVTNPPTIQPNKISCSEMSPGLMGGVPRPGGEVPIRPGVFRLSEWDHPA